MSQQRGTGRSEAKAAWGAGTSDPIPPGEDVEKTLADRVLTARPLVSAVRSVSKHPHLLDAVMYLAFLMLFTYVVIKAQDQSGIWPSSAPFHSMQLMLKRYGDKFLTIETDAQWFDYLERNVMAIVYPLTWYSGQAILTPDIGFAGAGSDSPDNFRILGAVQIRQVRTQKSTCPTTFQKEFRNLVLSCVGVYSPATQEVESFGPIENGLPRYGFSTKQENKENSYSGIFSTYDGGGYVITLPADGAAETMNRTRAKIQQMRKDKWIDRQTRAIFVTVNLFNPGTGYLTALRLILEHPATGGLHPSISMRHVPIGALFTDYAKLSTTLPEAFLTLAVFGFMSWEVYVASTMSFAKYFSRFWGIYDWINFALFIVAYSFRWAAYDRAKALTFPPSNEKFVNLETPAWHVVMWRNILAVTLIFCYLKLFKYLQLIPSLRHLFKKIFFTMTDVLYLLISFTFIFWGFTLSHFLAYGDEVSSFRTIPDSMIMLWRQMLGDLSAVNAMVDSNRILGPFFFVFFTSIVAVLLLTIFLGLLRESYVLADDQNDRIGLVQSLLESAIAPYLGLVTEFKLSREEQQAQLDALTAEEALAAQVEKKDELNEKLKGWDPQHVQARNDKAKQRREDRKDVLLQSLLTLSREARVVSRRVDTLIDSDAPDAGDLPDFFY